MFYSQVKIKQRGAVLVEFALVIPILVLIMMGAFELGWALYAQNSMEDAAREGARIAVTQENISTSSITSTVTSMLATDNISTASATVSVNPSDFTTATRGTAITVSVSIPYSSISILPTALYLGNTTLTAQVTMAKEY